MHTHTHVYTYTSMHTLRFNMSIICLHCIQPFQVPAKKMGSEPCGCALKCFDKISEDQRKRLFAGFWDSGNFDVQNAYLCGCVRVMKTKRKYMKAPTSRRKYTRMYFVKNSAISEEVCKAAFLSIHGISSGWLDCAIQAQIKTDGTPYCDERGRHAPGNKTTEDDIAFIKQHINSFPRYQSHYSRQDNPHRKYLSPELSVAKMYQLYKEKYREEERETVCSEWKTFNENFNLSFGM